MYLKRGLGSFILLILIGCATVNVQLTTQDTADWMLSIYNAQYNEYKSWFVIDPTTGDFKKDLKGNALLKPGTPKTQILILQQKKKIFIELWPLILAYGEYAKTGTVPAGMTATSLESRAIELVNELVRSK